MNPMRFYLVFDVQGNAQQQLQSIGAQFSSLGTLAQSSAQGVQSFHGSVIAMIHGLHQLNTVAHSVTAWGSEIITTMYGLAHSVVEAASSFETMRARMDFAFQEQSAHIWGNIQQYAVESVYRFGEVADVVGGLGIAIQGVSREFHDLPSNYTSRTGEMVNALQVIGDTASGTGRSLSMVGFEVEQMMTGMFRGAHMVLRLTQQETETIKHAISSTRDAQQQFAAIMNVLAAHYGGATEAMGHTFRFLSMQIPDILEILANSVGTGALAVLSSGLSEVVLWLRALVSPENAAFVASLNAAFTTLAEGVVWAGRGILALADKLRVLIANNPALVKFSATVVTLTGVLMVLGGTLAGITTAVGVVVASLQLAGATIVSSLAIATGVVTGLGLAVGALAAMGGVLYTAYDRNLGGIQIRFQQLSLIVSGLSQAFANWNGNLTAISGGLADQMESAGILGFFVNLVSWIARAREWWTGFVSGIQEGIASVGWEHIYEGIRSIERGLVSIGVSLNLLSPAAETSFSTMREQGHGFANLVNQIIVPGMNMLALTFRGVAWVFENMIVPLGHSFASLGLGILNNWEGVKGVIMAVSGFFFPLTTAMVLLLTYTNSWGTALSVVKGTFDLILSVAEMLARTVAYIGEGLGGLPAAASRVLGFSSGESRESGSANVNTTPAPLGQTLPAAYEQPPVRLQAVISGGESSPSGGISAEQMRALLEAIQSGTRGSTAPSSRANAPTVVVTNIGIDGESVSRASRRVSTENQSRGGEIMSRQHLYSGGD